MHHSVSRVRWPRGHQGWLDRPRLRPVQGRSALQVHAETAGRVGDKCGVGVLILPAFLSGAAPYSGMAATLRAAGFAADVVPLKVGDWGPVLLGGDFQFYLQRLDAALDRLYAAHGPVALVGHSAGGWVARILLGDVPYQGVRYSRRHMVHSLLTLGTPHRSIEQYPLGRVPEKLAIDDPGAPPEVAGSSLKFANHYYPRGDCFEGVRVVCACGNAIRGRQLWRRGNSVAGEAELGGRAAEPSGSALEAYFAYEGYLSGCGRGEVDGDGVTPICIAHLDGAENVVLEGVWHNPRRRPGELWYGSPPVIAQWQKYLARSHAVK